MRLIGKERVKNWSRLIKTIMYHVPNQFLRKQSAPPKLANPKEIQLQPYSARNPCIHLPCLSAPVAHIINIIVQFFMALHCQIPRQQQFRGTVLRALVVRILLRHRNQPLPSVQPSPLQAIIWSTPKEDIVEFRSLLEYGPAVFKMTR